METQIIEDVEVKLSIYFECHECNNHVSYFLQRNDFEYNEETKKLEIATFCEKCNKPKLVTISVQGS